MASLGLNLGAFNGALKPGRDLKEGRGDYRRLEEVGISHKVRDNELINKTDYLLRKLVESLELKLQQEKQGYLIEKAKIKSKIK